MRSDVMNGVKAGVVSGKTSRSIGWAAWLAGASGLAAVLAMAGGGAPESGRIEFPDAPGGGLSPEPRASTPFVNWETAHVHPLEMTPSGGRVLAVNTAAGTLEVFSLASGQPVHEATVAVGVDPVAVRARSETEVWVVNQISDSISIVDLSAMSVKATINTADEPSDVVFAGGRAFVTCTQPGVVQVYTLSNLGAGATTLSLEGNEPKNLAVSGDGSRVYAAFYRAGNGTTLLGGGATSRQGVVLGYPPNVVSDAASPYAGVNPPPNNGTGFFPALNSSAGTPPAVGLIVRKGADGLWKDDNNHDWTNLVSGADAAKSGRPVGWDLVDHDVAIIDSGTLGVTYAGNLMNVCMSLAVNPANGQVALVGTDAINQVRFEPNVNGRFVRVEIATFNPASPGTATIKDLNPHLDYTTSQVPLATRQLSIGDPRAAVFSGDGSKAYVAGMGSNNVIVWNTAASSVSARVTVPEGPTGLALDASRGKLYVLSKFAAKLTTVDTATNAVLGSVAYLDPTPQAIKVGRKHLYDTHKNSGLGQASCASCHVDGRTDRLAWDLGDPSGSVASLGSNNLGQGLPGLSASTANPGFSPFHPMKGPMTTQTLQDIVGKEPFHWRGDRTGIEAFNGAFLSLMGNDAQLTSQEMQEFEDFLATITFPPNPYRNFDNSLSGNVPLPGHYTTGRFAAAGAPLPNGSAVRGLALYRSTTRLLDGNALACVSCHTLPTGAGTDYTFSGLSYSAIPVGSKGEHHLSMVSVDGSTQTAIKIPQIRNAYTKTGFNTTQLRNTSGFGFLHDGSIDSLERFVSEPVFGVKTDQEVADLVAFVFSMTGSELPAGATNKPLEPPGVASNDSHASVGYQMTLAGAPTSAQQTTLTSMLTLANASKVGLIAKLRQADRVYGGSYQGGNLWQMDQIGFTKTQAALLASAGVGTELTITVVPYGAQNRLGIDRDGDGWYDGDELQVCSDPNDPAVYPGSAGCPDVTGDLFVDIFDFQMFVDLFTIADPRSDFNRDGFVDIFDFNDFVTVFEEGCTH